MKFCQHQILAGNIGSTGQHVLMSSILVTVEKRPDIVKHASYQPLLEMDPH